ncbi:hypothetical protein RJ640_009794 [Escallonia rubra]|uniref:WPP domain-containing protein n=1 Tax=Escallonia rubra TaxID=112253 RepID=A0AA88RLQ4_9ASTE|nr:hypothetical protein RJ640_009794 [Escallonia rubra]
MAAEAETLTLDSQPQQSQPKKVSVSFSIWPPTQHTRDTVLSRLIETLSTPSVLSKHDGLSNPDKTNVMLPRWIKFNELTPPEDWVIENKASHLQVNPKQQNCSHRSRSLTPSTQIITDLLNRTHLDAAKPVHTPMATSTHLSRYHGDPHPSPTEYRSIVGALQYLSFTRPDISFSVNKVAQFMHSPTCEHWSAVKRILRYLKDTLHFGLCLSKPPDLSLSAYSDTDWAGCPDDRRSTSGFCVYLGCNRISWSSRKQPTVARSSTEAEYKAIATVASELEWLKSLLFELHLAPPKPPTLWCDNIGSVYLSLNPIFHARTKHVEIDYHFVRERVARKAWDVRFISTVDQPADIFTKPLSLPRFRILRSKLNVVDTLSLRGGIGSYHHLSKKKSNTCVDNKLQSSQKIKEVDKDSSLI